MKFLFFTHDIDSGGAARSLLTLVKQLLILNHQVKIVSFAYSNPQKKIATEYEKMRVQVFYFPWAWLTGKFKGLTIDTTGHKKKSQEMRHYLPTVLNLAKNVDTVCFNGYPSASLAGNIQGVKKILIAREQLDIEDRQYLTIAKFLARHIDQGIGISPAETKQLDDMGIAQKQIYNAAQDYPKFHSLPPLPLRFGVFGAIYNMKGQLTLVDACAFQQAFLRAAKATVHIYGMGKDLPLVLERIQNYGIEDLVIYEGWTDSVEEAMCSLHWIVRPDHDGSPWGRDVIEAMSLGRPVLATGSADCFIKQGKTGLLVPPKDYKALGIALKNICMNDTQTEQYAQEAFIFAKNEFNPLEQAKKFIQWISV